MKRKNAQSLWGKRDSPIFFVEMGLYKEALPSLYSFPLEHEFALCFILFCNICITYSSCFKSEYKTTITIPPPSVKDNFQYIYEEDVLNEMKCATSVSSPVDRVKNLASSQLFGAILSSCVDLRAGFASE